LGEPICLLMKIPEAEVYRLTKRPGMRREAPPDLCTVNPKGTGHKVSERIRYRIASDK